jgi:hypothetical protein
VNKKVAIRKEPMRRAGRRPNRSRYKMAGRVYTTESVLLDLRRTGVRLTYHSDVDDVLNGCSEQLVGDTSSPHNKYDIVHHDIHPAQLRPHLNRHTEDDALDNTRLHKSAKAGLSLLALEAKSVFNLPILGKDLGVVQVTAAMEVSKDRESLLPAIFGSKPSG